VKAERTKWEARYRAGARPHDGLPSGMLRRWLPDLPRGRALDVATGLGRNALFLARAGYRVDAVDISPTGLAVAARRARRRGLRIRWVEADLDTYPLPKARYDVVVNAFFLKRRLITTLKASVKPGGVMLVETHLMTDEPDGGPPGRTNRLRPGELQRLFRGWEILDLEEGPFREGGREWDLGRILARRPRRGSTRRRRST
jgi:SAM-dependent methyltransferase